MCLRYLRIENRVDIILTAFQQLQPQLTYLPILLLYYVVLIALSDRPLHELLQLLNHVPHTFLLQFCGRICIDDLPDLGKALLVGIIGLPLKLKLLILILYFSLEQLDPDLQLLNFGIALLMTNGLNNPSLLFLHSAPNYIRSPQFPNSFYQLFRFPLLPALPPHTRPRLAVTFIIHRRLHPRLHPLEGKRSTGRRQISVQVGEGLLSRYKFLHKNARYITLAVLT